MSQGNAQREASAATPGQSPHRRYIAGFDGLRTLGVLGVILYHLRPDIFRGGYLGVPIFMVVSGYLITDGLVMTYERTHTLQLHQFFLRRVKRLYPALIAVLFGTSAYIGLFARQLLHNLHWQVLTNLTYVYNWWQIGHGQSYFARYANGQAPFTHLWTLSIEGQFYLVWPFLVLVGLWLIKKRRRLAGLTLGLALVSAVWLATLYQWHFAQPGVDPSRLYYGTDTRAFSLLLGAALAFIWPSGKLNAQARWPERLVLNGVGAGALVGILALAFTLDAQSRWLYDGGMFLFSVLTTLLVAAIVHPAGIFDRLLANPLFHWIGTRSYGLYLYQFPVMILFEQRFTQVAAHPLLYPVIEVSLIVGLSELSYRWLEQPIAHFDFRQWRGYLVSLVRPRHHFGRRQVVSYVAVVILALGAYGLMQAPGVKASAGEAQLAHHLRHNELSKRQAARELAKQRARLQAKHHASHGSTGLATESRRPQPRLKPTRDALTPGQLARAKQVTFTAIGDSVMLDGRPMLQHLFPQAFINAAVSRQMRDSIALVHQYAQSGALAPIVVIGLGTNGPFNRPQLEAMLRAIGPQHRVLWINVHVPTRPWQNEVNQLLADEARHNPHLSVIDWAGFSQAHPEWFYHDQVHPNPTGMPHYARFIAKAILAATP